MGGNFKWKLKLQDSGRVLVDNMLVLIRHVLHFTPMMLVMLAFQVF